MDTNVPSTLPTTLDGGIEKIIENRVDNVGTHTIRSKSSIVDLGTILRSDMRLLNGSTEHVRDLTYAGPGKVTGELGDGHQHLLCCYDGVGDMEIYNKGENSEQVVANHN